jgi:hypothetical protein
VSIRARVLSERNHNHVRAVSYFPGNDEPFNAFDPGAPTDSCKIVQFPAETFLIPVLTAKNDKRVLNLNDSYSAAADRRTRTRHRDHSPRCPVGDLSPLRRSQLCCLNPERLHGPHFRQGAVRTRDYELEDAKHRIVEVRADTIASFDRAEPPR